MSFFDIILYYFGFFRFSVKISALTAAFLYDNILYVEMEVVFFDFLIGFVSITARVPVFPICRGRGRKELFF